MKVCSKCNVEKDEIEFYKRKEAKDGMQPYCKVCCNLLHAEYAKNNREKINKKNRESLEHNEKSKARRAKFILNNPLKTKEYSKAYRENNKDDIAAKNKEKYQENKEMFSIKSKIYREKNKESIREQKKKYYEKNPEKFKQYRENRRIKNGK